MNKFQNYTLALSSALVAMSCSVSADDDLEYRISFDAFTQSESTMKGMVGVSILKRLDNGFYWGPTLYSAALGDAGGLFIGGVELGKTTDISDNLFLDANIYFGGGGGSGQIPGDGFMVRPRVAIGRKFDNFALTGGVSWTKISGSDISTPGIEVAFMKPMNLAFSSGTSKSSSVDYSEKTKFNSIKFFGKYYNVMNSLKHNSTTPLTDMHIMGAELTFSKDGPWEYFMDMSGAFGGDGEGYAEWFLGTRYYHNMGKTRLFADVSMGLAGGGAVDTGKGFVASANAGISLPISKSVFIDTSIGYTSALNGNFKAVSPMIKLGKRLGSTSNTSGSISSNNWELFVGVSHIFENAHLRKPNASNSGALSLITFQLNYMAGEKFYITSLAHTIFDGNAGGFAIGAFGLGYKVPISDRITVSPEVFFGGAGGGAINTQGGLIGISKMNFDYDLSEKLALRFGGGWMQSLRSGGMKSKTIEAGLKFKFTTFH